MKIKRYEDLNLQELDVMREIGSIGTSHAATALSKLLKKETRITIPTVSILGCEEAAERIGDMEKETVAAPGKMSREEKSKIIRPLIKKGLKNKEIAERTGIPLGTVNGLSGPIRKELKNPVKAEMIKSGDNSDRHKCRTCQYRHSDAGGCDYCIHTGRERGCDVEVCDKAVAGARLTKK